MSTRTISTPSALLVVLDDPLQPVEGVKLYSLQRGEPSSQAASPPGGMRLVDWTGELRDFADDAALVAHLDLVVGVDTSMARLTGALGKPVWLLALHVAD